MFVFSTFLICLEYSNICCILKLLTRLLELSYTYHRIIHLTSTILCAKFADAQRATSVRRKSKTESVQDAAKHLLNAPARKKRNKQIS